MKLSIVTPAFNAARWLPACVASVRHACAGQDYEHWIIDGGSTDGTKDFLQANLDLRWVSEPDQGMYDALNKGVERAAGEVIGHLNADEQYNRSGFHSALELISTRKEIDMVFGPTVMVDGDGNFLQLYKQIVRPNFKDFIWSMPVQSCSVLYRRALWQRLGYDTRYRISADHAWFYGQMRLGMKLAPVMDPFGIFTWHPANLSNSGKIEDALPGINRHAFDVQLCKHIYRFRKLLAGGYRPAPIDYEIFQNGELRKMHITKPALKISVEKLRGQR